MTSMRSWWAALWVSRSMYIPNSLWWRQRRNEDVLIAGTAPRRKVGEWSSNFDFTQPKQFQLIFLQTLKCSSNNSNKHRNSSKIFLSHTNCIYTAGQYSITKFPSSTSILEKVISSNPLLCQYMKLSVLCLPKFLADKRQCLGSHWSSCECEITSCGSPG